MPGLLGNLLPVGAVLCPDQVRDPARNCARARIFLAHDLAQNNPPHPVYAAAIPRAPEDHMNPVTIAKLVLAVVGIVLFLLGIRSGLDLMRWTGIGLVAAAFLMRFVGRTHNGGGSGRTPTRHDHPED